MKKNLSLHHQWKINEVHFLRPEAFSVCEDEVLSRGRKSKSVAQKTKVTKYPYAMLSIGQNDFIMRVNTKLRTKQNRNDNFS